ncbi:MAG TPA: TonB-dependent receptor, partial [Bacteroidia bacterium]|nr:TonB-dependent receptor [Bacteroidia bacterium]
MKKVNISCILLKLFSLFLALVLSNFVYAQTTDSTLFPHNLKKLSLEDLMNIEVTSVSKRPEKLTEVASAIQVITYEDIRRSGVKTLPEALKLAANLQVAQVNSSQWAISARGFSNVLANKLLVLMDGRTIYTPMYAGVFWDVQNVLLEDVDRIEVISGPGGTLWGANAVNGVINIITKSAADTKGFFAETAYGSNMQGSGSIRYGGKITKDISYRVFATGFQMGSVLDTNGVKVDDEWKMAKGGLRIDWNSSERNKLSLLANSYYGRPNPESDSIPVIASGNNALIRWNYVFSEKIDCQLQAYYDRTWRDFGNKFTEDLKTYDIEWQNRFKIGKQHSITYGLGFRKMDHDVANLELFGFFPAKKTLYLSNGFLQYEILFLENKLRLTVGSKVEHNTYTQFQYQPNGRITFIPTKKQTLWAAVSRAVRNPSRIDREFKASLLPTLPIIMGSDSFQSETAIAYELGWRFQPIKKISISLSTFYNEYDDLRSAEPGHIFLNYPITFANGVKGKTYGIELFSNTELTKWWSLRYGYTFLRKELEVKPNSKDLNKATAESNDPEHQIMLQSTVDLPYHFQLGTVVRYVDKLPKPAVPYYIGLDVRLSWELGKFLELSV